MQAIERQSERDCLAPAGQNHKLNARLGSGIGAKRERTKLQAEVLADLRTIFGTGEEK